jgi:hypothetical protein
MKRFRWKTALCVFVLALSMSISVSHAAKNIYLYEPSVSDEVDINAYKSNGTCRRPHNGGMFQYTVAKGPAPAPYPTIDVSEKSFEHLGLSNAQIDGVYFLNHGDYYTADKKALVLYVVRIPAASQRAKAEFGNQLTLSLWVDWNQDNTWKPGERMVSKSFSIANEFPTSHNDVYVWYLTWFKVPDITSQEFLDAQWWNDRDDRKDVRKMWVRALVAYDDADVSPDGDQLFGEYEDYRVSYLVKTKDRRDDDHGGRR